MVLKGTEHMCENICVFCGELMTGSSKRDVDL